VGMRLVALGTPAAQGMPSSRLTIMAWLPMAPTSTTTPADTMNNGVQEGSVCGATRISPGSKSAISDRSWITRARPRAMPAEAGAPTSTSPGVTVGAAAASVRSSSDTGFIGSPPTTKVGGARSNSSRHSFSRWRSVSRYSPAWVASTSSSDSSAMKICRG